MLFFARSPVFACSTLVRADPADARACSEESGGRERGTGPDVSPPGNQSGAVPARTRSRITAGHGPKHLRQGRDGAAGAPTSEAAPVREADVADGRRSAQPVLVATRRAGHRPLRVRRTDGKLVWRLPSSAPSSGPFSQIPGGILRRHGCDDVRPLAVRRCSAASTNQPLWACSDVADGPGRDRAGRFTLPFDPHACHVVGAPPRRLRIRTCYVPTGVPYLRRTPALQGPA